MALRTESILLTYLGVAIVALIYRVIAIPWDWGGLFAQLMTACFVVMLVGNGNLPALRGFQLKLFYVLFVILNLLSFVEVYFAPQAILPFIIVCLVLVRVWCKSKWKLFDTVVLALPLTGLMVYGLFYTIPILRLRHLSSQQVREIRLAPPNIQLTSQTETTPFLLALRSTTPYAPNHDTLNAPRQVTILLNSGDTISFTISKGTRANANTCRVVVGVTSYQNEPLCRLLDSVAQ